VQAWPASAAGCRQLLQSDEIDNSPQMPPPFSQTSTGPARTIGQLAKAGHHVLHLTAGLFESSDHGIRTGAQDDGGFRDAAALNLAQDKHLAARSPQLKGMHDHSLHDSRWSRTPAQDGPREFFCSE